MLFWHVMSTFLHLCYALVVEAREWGDKEFFKWMSFIEIQQQRNWLLRRPLGRHPFRKPWWIRGLGRPWRILGLGAAMADQGTPWTMADQGTRKAMASPPSSPRPQPLRPEVHTTPPPPIKKSLGKVRGYIRLVCRRVGSWGLPWKHGL